MLSEESNPAVTCVSTLLVDAILCSIFVAFVEFIALIHIVLTSVAMVTLWACAGVVTDVIDTCATVVTGAWVAVVVVLLALDAFISRVALTDISIDGILAGPVGSTRVTLTFVDVCLTPRSCESVGTFAIVAIHLVCATTSMQARITSAVINVVFAMRPFESVITDALVSSLQRVMTGSVLTLDLRVLARDGLGVAQLSRPALPTGTLEAGAGLVAEAVHARVLAAPVDGSLATCAGESVLALTNVLANAVIADTSI